MSPSIPHSNKEFRPATEHNTKVMDGCSGTGTPCGTWWPRCWTVCVPSPACCCCSSSSSSSSLCSECNCSAESSTLTTHSRRREATLTPSGSHCSLSSKYVHTCKPVLHWRASGVRPVRPWLSSALLSVSRHSLSHQNTEVLVETNSGLAQSRDTSSAKRDSRLRTSHTNSLIWQFAWRSCLHCGEIRVIHNDTFGVSARLLLDTLIPPQWAAFMSAPSWVCLINFTDVRVRIWHCRGFKQLCWQLSAKAQSHLVYSSSKSEENLEIISWFTFALCALLSWTKLKCEPQIHKVFSATANPELFLTNCQNVDTTQKKPW